MSINLALSASLVFLGMNITGLVGFLEHILMYSRFSESLSLSESLSDMMISTGGLVLLGLGDLADVLALVDGFTGLSTPLTELVTSGFSYSDFSGGTGN